MKNRNWRKNRIEREDGAKIPKNMTAAKRGALSKKGNAQGSITHRSIKNHYDEMQADIRTRLSDFAIKKSSDELFLDLCFCICTPQSKAIKVAEVIKPQNLDKLLRLEHKALAGMLRKNTRFHNNKALHIINARRYYNDISHLPKDTMLAREFLVSNIKGIGYKEASHFLRNIGYRDLCIVDRHVINIMYALRIFDTDKGPSSPKKYLDMESKIKSYARDRRYDIDELDLALWSYKTGYVFK